jgi:hypothetical protein
MNAYIISAVIVTVIYAIVKFLQMRFVDKENRPLKELISDSCIVFLSSCAGLFAAGYLGSIGGICNVFGVQIGGESSNPAKAFIGRPNF